MGSIPLGLGGSVVCLEQRTASTTSTLNFTTCISSAYDEYLIEFVNIIPTTDAVDIWLRMSTDGGGNYDSGNNYFANNFNWNNGGTGFTGQANSAKTSAIKLANAGNISNSSNYGCCGSMRLFSPLSTAHHKFVNYQVAYLNNNGTVIQSANGAGAYAITTAVNAFQFLPSNAGTFASGNIRVYGMTKS